MDLSLLNLAHCSQDIGALSLSHLSFQYWAHGEMHSASAWVLCRTGRYARDRHILYQLVVRQNGCMIGSGSSAAVNDAKAGLHGALKPAQGGAGALREKKGACWDIYHVPNS